MRRFFFVFLLFAIPAFFAFAGRKADFDAINIDNPTSLFYSGRPYFSTDLTYVNSVQRPGGRRHIYRTELEALVASPNFAVQVYMDSVMSGDADNLSEASVSNSYDIKIALGFGYRQLGFGAGWNLSGVRKKDIANYGLKLSFADYLENLLVLHNDTGITDLYSDFSLHIAYNNKRWAAFSLYIARFFSLSEQSIYFSGSDILNSLSASVALKTFEYDRYHSPRTFSLLLLADFGDIFSEEPSFEGRLDLRFILSGKSDIVLRNSLSYGNMKEDFVQNSQHEIDIIFSYGGYYFSLGGVVPAVVYAGDRAEPFSICANFQISI